MSVTSFSTTLLSIHLVNNSEVTIMIGTMSAMTMMTVTPMHILRNDNTGMELTYEKWLTEQ